MIHPEWFLIYVLGFQAVDDSIKYIVTWAKYKGGDFNFSLVMHASHDIWVQRLEIKDVLGMEEKYLILFEKEVLNNRVSDCSCDLQD